MNDAYVPEPMTAHPHYGALAESIRSHLARSSHPVRIAEAPRFDANFYASEGNEVYSASFNTRTLVIRKCASPAPFVGDPLLYSGWYYWYAAVDDVGRHVAGEATLDIFWHPKF